MRFIFYHGWGLCNHFWQHLAPFFNDYECIFLESRYFTHKNNITKIPKDNIKNIAIGHSLGFIKLVLMKEIKWHKLISVAGFSKFVNTPETSKNLKYLKNTLIADPIKGLLLFYELAGLNDDFWKKYIQKVNINQKLLSQDLNLLEKINIQIPNNTLHIVGDRDKVLDHHSLINAKNIILPNTGHNIGYINPEEIFKQINNFIIN